MHDDLWMPGKITNEVGEILQLMNCMCDLTQFVISILVNDATYKMLAKIFMEHVVLSFEMVAVVVVDADNKLLSVIEVMCSALDIEF